MQYIRINNPEGTLKKWREIEKKLQDIASEIRNAKVEFETGGDGECVTLKVVNKNEFIDTVEEVNELLKKAAKRLNWDLRLEVEMTEGEVRKSDSK